jgi:hypothetical protein
MKLTAPILLCLLQHRVTPQTGKVYRNARVGFIFTGRTVLRGNHLVVTYWTCSYILSGRYCEVHLDLSRVVNRIITTFWVA